MLFKDRKTGLEKKLRPWTGYWRGFHMIHEREEGARTCSGAGELIHRIHNFSPSFIQILLERFIASCFRGRRRKHQDVHKS